MPAVVFCDLLQPKEKNKIGVPVATAVGLGAIIGAGIFVLSGTAVALAGADALIAFIIVGVLAIIEALELGELGSLMPEVKGASYSYTYKAFGSELGFMTGMLRYMGLATAVSVIALGFGSYLASLAGISSASYPVFFAIALIAVLAVVNLFGIKKAAETDLALVLIKLGILGIFIAFALYIAFTGVHSNLSGITFDLSGNGWNGIFAASVVVFFAYSGYQAIASISSRIKGGSSGYVTSILSAVVISIVVYLLVVVGLLILLPPSAYNISGDPLSHALKISGAPSYLSILIDIGALVATASAAVAMILSASLSLYQMSSDHLLPKFLKRYDNKSGAALNGILVTAVISMLMLFTGNIYVIASIANFGIMFNYLLIGFDVIHFRRRNVKSPFRIPLYPYLPLLGIFLLLVFFTGLPKEALVVGTLAIILLLIVYYFLREIKEKKVVRVKLFD